MVGSGTGTGADSAWDARRLVSGRPAEKSAAKLPWNVPSPWGVIRK